jgi:Mrp family chromosome partitioning ATPase
MEKKTSRFIANNKIIEYDSTDSSLFKLDFVDLKNNGFINPTVRRSLLGEEIRLIKRRLFQKISLFDNDDDEHHHHRNDSSRTDIVVTKERKVDHVIQVTSTKPNEGKSFIALNLALSIAMEEQYNVLLVDADITRCSLTNTLNFQREAGLTDVLRDVQPDLRGVLKRDKQYPFTFLPAGSGVASAADLFGGRKMKRLVSDIANRYNDRIIIIDTPPLLAGTEAVVLSHYVGQVLYVVDASLTPHHMIESGLDLLDNYNNVSLILNKTPQFANSDQFGAYYEYYGKTQK